MTVNVLSLFYAVPWDGLWDVIVAFPGHARYFFNELMPPSTGGSGSFFLLFVKVRKAAKIRNQYNQVPHLTHDTTWKSDKNTNITNKSQEVSPFPAGVHKEAMNRRERMANTRYN